MGQLKYDRVPEPLRNALIHVIDRAEAGGPGAAGPKFARALHGRCTEHFGWAANTSVGLFLERVSAGEPFLDFVEILVEEGSRKRDHQVGTSRSFRAVLPDAESKSNALFERHRFGFIITEGEARKIGSDALEAVIVGPALMAVQRAGWEEVERSFREALRHQRGGPDEMDDALTAANAALEAALKAVGLKGDRLSALAKSLRNSGLVPSQLEGVPELLDGLLKRSGAIRDPLSDAHGKAPGAEQVPQELADLAIHWAGAFIVYLSEASGSPSAARAARAA